MRSHLFGGLFLAALFTLSQAIPAGGEEKKEKDDKFVPLFNGKDLTGWKTHPDDKGKWEVVDGAIVGTGPVGHLYTERGDYQNFRFRIEAMISDKGNSGQMFRCVYSKGFPKGYEAQINATHGDPDSHRQPVSRLRQDYAGAAQEDSGPGGAAQARRVVHPGSDRRRQPHHHQGQRQDDGRFRG